MQAPFLCFYTEEYEKFRFGCRATALVVTLVYSTPLMHQGKEKPISIFSVIPSGRFISCCRKARRCYVPSRTICQHFCGDWCRGGHSRGGDLGSGAGGVKKRCVKYIDYSIYLFNTF